MKRGLALAALLLCAPASAQPDPAAANIKADMAYLASDRLKGREAGTPEYDMAARYVAQRMKEIGLVPRGDKGGYFQHVPLLAFRTKDQGVLTLHDATGHAMPLVFGADYVVRGNALAADLAVDAPLVFVGYGLVAPEHGRDDYRGLDVKGKIVVALSGSPKFLQSEERAYYTNARTKLATALAHGAVGFISVDTLTDAKLHPFANAVRQYQSWGMSWRKPDGAPFVPAPLPSLGAISVTGAQKLFGKDTAQILAAAETNDGMVRGFALPWSLKAELHSEIKNVESENIVGLLPGSDPKLKNEYVVLSAHLDHLGITPPVNGDSINNGALDNASGVSTTLEVARLFERQGGAALGAVPDRHRRGKRPDRGGIFRPQSHGAARRHRRGCGPGHADPDLRIHRCGGVRRRPLQRRAVGPARRRKHGRQAVARSHAGRGRFHPLRPLPFCRAGHTRPSSSSPALPMAARRPSRTSWRITITSPATIFPCPSAMTWAPSLPA